MGMPDAVTEGTLPMVGVGFETTEPAGVAMPVGANDIWVAMELFELVRVGEEGRMLGAGVVIAAPAPAPAPALEVAGVVVVNDGEGLGARGLELERMCRGGAVAEVGVGVGVECAEEAEVLSVEGCWKVGTVEG